MKKPCMLSILTSIVMSIPAVAEPACSVNAPACHDVFLPFDIPTSVSGQPNTDDNLSLQDLLMSLDQINLLEKDRDKFLREVMKVGLIMRLIDQHCYTIDELDVLSSALKSIWSGWNDLDTSANPSASFFVHDMEGFDVATITCARSQIVLEERLCHLQNSQEKLKLLVFHIAGFNPKMCALDPNLAAQIIDSCLPVCKKLHLFGRSSPFDDIWAHEKHPEGHAREKALHNMKNGTVFVLLEGDAPVIFMLKFEHELWIGPCGVDEVLSSFHFGPDPDPLLFNMLGNLSDKLFEKEGRQVDKKGNLNAAEYDGI